MYIFMFSSRGARSLSLLLFAPSNMCIQKVAHGNVCTLNAASNDDGAPIPVAGAAPFLGNAPEYAAGAAPAGLTRNAPPAGMGVKPDYAAGTAAGAAPDGAHPNAAHTAPAAPAGLGAAAAYAVGIAPHHGICGVGQAAK